MTRRTTGHPTRAFAGLLAVILAWEASRLPAHVDRFAAELAMVRAARRGVAARPIAMARVAVARDGGAIPVAPTIAPAAIAFPHLAAPRTRAVASAEAASRRLAAQGPGASLRAYDGDSADVTVLAISIDGPIPPSDASRPGSTDTTAASFATAAYARLAAGDRRAGARLLDAATLIGGDPRARAWTRDRDALHRRWSGSAYVIARRTGDAGLAGTPVLGGGQTGAAIAFTPDPLARRPISLTLRDFAANTTTGIDGETAQAAVGIGWRVLPGLVASAERMIPLGSATRGAWSARVAGGARTRRLGIDVSAYAEAGIVGDATYVAVQARADAPRTLGRLTLHAGAGAWASLQHDRRSVRRIDAGPGLRIGHAASPVELAIDYRFRLSGNAAPGSGPVLTLSTAF